MPIVLGIETSCDETSVAIVEDGSRVRCNLIATQYDLHAKYGGVVPEIASRAHLEKLDLLIAEALKSADLDIDEIEALCVTSQPGLIGALLIGVTAAKSLAWVLGVPVIGVNHVYAHATSAAMSLPHDPWPAVALVVSGGHTSIFHVADYDKIESLGATVDDAAGEAFDKVASILGLGYPGGPAVDRLSREGRPAAIRFPRTLLGPESLDFSFSGLKTAVLYHVHGAGRTSGGLERLGSAELADICASFSDAVAQVLVEKTMRAVKRTGVRTVVVGGGVAANSMLRSALAHRCQAEGIALHVTAAEYCTDNAAMIAALGFQLLRRGHASDLTLKASASITCG